VSDGNDIVGAGLVPIAPEAIDVSMIGKGAEPTILCQARVWSEPLKHVEGAGALLLQLDLEDVEGRTRKVDLILLPEQAEGLAEHLLMGLARQGRLLPGEAADTAQARGRPGTSSSRR
jgi:hypothetical protein